jgi:predicted transcriptional regulator
MPTDATTTLHLSPELSEKLDALARDMQRSKSDLASEAISSYIDRAARQLEEIKKGLEEARSGALGVPHDEVVKWVESWGTENELPRPKPKH